MDDIVTGLFIVGAFCWLILTVWGMLRIAIYWHDRNIHNGSKE
jgi:hypothetical protein